MRALVLLVIALGGAGCRHHFPLPYSVNQLQHDSAKWPGDALVHYLGQPNADVEVCTVNGPQAAVRRADAELVDPFVASLEQRTLAPPRWLACATQLTPSVSSETREYFLGRLAKAILLLFEVDTAAPQLIAANEVLAERPREKSPALEGLMKQLALINRQKLPPQLPPIYDSLVTTLELEQGHMQGRALTQADIVEQQDDSLLLRMAVRLPDEALRDSARHKAVQLRMARSDFPEVKQRAAECEAAVFATGRWAQPRSALKLKQPDLPLTLEVATSARQDLLNQVVTLLAPGDKSLQVAPTIDLRPTLRFAVGWSRPLMLCGPPSAVSVEPCVDAKDVELGNPALTFDAQGVMRLPERLPMVDAANLALAGEGLVAPVTLQGQLVTTLQVPLSFLAPDSYFFEGDPAQPGPAVNMAVTPTVRNLVFEAVSESGARVYAICPRDRIGGFQFGSKGGTGVSGYHGRDGVEGARGSNGNSASCPSSPGQQGGNGGPGGNGENGSPGGPGGDGGLVSVEVRCGRNCPEDERLVRSIVRSIGGDGGSGGTGGRGGSGGSGGSGGNGTSCTVNGVSQYLSSGSSGSRGSDGQRGYDGPGGEPGRDGQVRVIAR